MKIRILSGVIFSSLLLFAISALAQEVVPGKEEIMNTLQTISDYKIAMDTVWTLFAAFLVMFMALGFAMLESGFCRSKNTVNILAKNLLVFSLTSLSFLFIGWGFMFGDGTGFIGTKGLWLLSGADNSPAIGDAYQGVYSSISWTDIPLEAKFLFQVVFAATAATIISGAVAERIKFKAFFIFSIFMGGLLYPITGHWIWGGGWLAERGMWDFAGSTVVHSVGGWAALAGALMLGPRIGKYTKDGRINPIPGHNLTSATIGAFVLWFGWFGFNPGSTMAADWAAIGHIALTTNTAAAAGVVGAMLLAWVLLGKPDQTMAINGAIGGLVAITCPCAFVSVGSSIFIGFIAGFLVVLSVLFFDRIRVDDPVGAISAHLMCGIWGTLSLGLFAQNKFMPDTTGDGLFFGGGGELLGAQFIGVIAVGGFIFFGSIVLWSLIKGVIGIRVSAEEELEGLDLGEHGNIAYPDFQIAYEVGSREAKSLEEEIEQAERRKERMLGIMGAVGARRTETQSPSSTVTKTEEIGEPIQEPVVYKAPSGQFKAIVDMDKQTLKRWWEELCNQEVRQRPEDFNEIFKRVARFQDRTIYFRKGNPEETATKLEKLLGAFNARVRIEIGEE